MLQCYIVVLQSGIRQSTLCPSLPCARAILEAVCPPAPLRDTADRSLADITLIWILLRSGFAPATLRKLAETYLACVFIRQCHTGFAHRPLDLMTLTSLLSAHRGFRVSLFQPFKQPALSELITECFLIDVSDPALCTGSQLVRPGGVLLVSCRAVDWDWLLPATRARMLTGGLVTYVSLRPLTREAWLVAPPISMEAHAAVCCFGCGGWVMCTLIICTNRRSVDVLLLTWTHVLLIILCCVRLFYVSACCGTVGLFGLCACLAGLA